MTTVEAVDVCDSAGGHKVSHFWCWDRVVGCGKGMIANLDCNLPGWPLELASSS